MQTVFPALPQACKHSLGSSNADQTVLLPRGQGRGLHGKCLQQKTLPESLIIYQNQKILEVFRVGQRKWEQESQTLSNTLQSLLYFYFILLLSSSLFYCTYVYDAYVSVSLPWHGMAWMWGSEGTCQPTVPMMGCRARSPVFGL